VGPVLSRKSLGAWSGATRAVFRPNLEPAPSIQHGERGYCPSPDRVALVAAIGPSPHLPTARPSARGVAALAAALGNAPSAAAMARHLSVIDNYVPAGRIEIGLLTRLPRRPIRELGWNYTTRTAPPFGESLDIWGGLAWPRPAFDLTKDSLYNAKGGCLAPGLTESSGRCPPLGWVLARRLAPPPQQKSGAGALSRRRADRGAADRCQTCTPNQVVSS